MAGGVGRTVALVALVALLSMAMAEDTVTSRLMQGQETGRGRAGGSDATLELDRPWDEGREVEKKERLQDVLKAIKEAEAADREAAKQEKAFGGKKLADANSATAQAAKFMSKAERLLRSEEALKQEERNVEAKLVSLKDSGVMGGHWRSHGTEFADEWRIYPKRPLERLKEVARRRAMLKSSKGKKGKGKNGKGKVVAVNDDVSDLDKDGKLQSRASDQFNDLPQGKPYGDNQWTDSKPKVRWSYYRKNTIKAGFDLSNCFLAAQKDKSQVVVKILEKQETHIIKTANGCTCQMPWKYFPDESSDGQLQESSKLKTYDRCSKNGSSKPWCAVEGTCGTLSTDPHAGYGPEDYGWTHWDYCASEKVGYKYAPVWQAKHSAGDVSCLADFFLSTDRALEWRSLDLLRQDDDSSKERMSPPDLASRFEKCLMRANTGSSAVYCEADMLKHLEPSVVRHALMITRSDKIGVHWANLQRVVLLFAKQMKGCMATAQGASEGIVCIAQFLTALPLKQAKLAVTNAMDTPQSEEAPKDVPVLVDDMIACIRSASDEDAVAFCVATFLAHAPKNTILSAAKMSKRTRDYGSAGFLNVMGEAQAGWVGYEDNLQARSMQKRQERVLS